ncbi:hypothetical protein GCM10018781_65980 [Kitasatospora indigofera]|uniref:Uncharacterized protein n=1 Tax=Kitasatospora indigofera TaxID=67307 RepID=A0A919L2Z3_9ACTN|nr:hypothetical protein [Kitasatospora indigofera]GHH82002.1 hypothetical protein GCM10018781_65980 [Kitasatospora indigofera]
MSPRKPAQPLSSYLNDHLTGAFGGAAPARRTAGAHGDPRRAADLRSLAREVEEDRDALVRTMNRLGVPVRHYRTWLGVAGERIGRLKPNGTLLHRAPLSDLIELEAMRTGVEGEAALWQALRAVADHDPRPDPAELDRLARRALDQARTLKDWHRTVSAEVLSTDGASVGGGTGRRAGGAGSDARGLPSKW